MSQYDHYHLVDNEDNEDNIIIIRGIHFFATASNWQNIQIFKKKFSSSKILEDSNGSHSTQRLGDGSK